MWRKLFQNKSVDFQTSVVRGSSAGSFAAPGEGSTPCPASPEHPAGDGAAARAHQPPAPGLGSNRQSTTPNPVATAYLVSWTHGGGGGGGEGRSNS